MKKFILILLVLPALLLASDPPSLPPNAQAPSQNAFDK